jgi:hypothetical protein
VVLPYPSSEQVLTRGLTKEGLRYCGVGVGYDDIFVQGNPAELKFIAYYIREGQVTAVAR